MVGQGTGLPQEVIPLVQPRGCTLWCTPVMPARHGSLGSIACGADQGQELGCCVSVVDAGHGSMI